MIIRMYEESGMNRPPVFGFKYFARIPDGTNATKTVYTYFPAIIFLDRC